jgi:hypothetical protein
MSLSAAALLALRDVGYDWPSANGWAHWTYQDKPLIDLVNEHLAAADVAVASTDQQ